MRMTKNAYLTEINAHFATRQLYSHFLTILLNFPFLLCCKKILFFCGHPSFVHKDVAKPCVIKI